MVAAVYPHLDTALVPLARQSATAHLRKLVDDGLASQAGEEWMLS